MKRFLLTILAIAILSIPVMAQTPAKAKPAPKAAATSTTKAGPLLDINTATEAELQTLVGIGPAYSKKIKDGRPYNGKDDLVNRNIIPQATYDKIKDQIIAKQPAKKK